MYSDKAYKNIIQLQTYTLSHTSVGPELHARGTAHLLRQHYRQHLTVPNGPIVAQL